MGDVSAGQLRTLAGQVRAEFPLPQRSVDEVSDATASDGTGASGRIHLYATAALLDTYYSGVERVLERIARAFDAMPAGPRWHADLLAAAALDVPNLRPAVLSPTTCAGLKPYLSFRHRFRNLYLFDLDAQQIAPLVGGVDANWTAVRTDLAAFAGALEAMAGELERGV